MITSSIKLRDWIKLKNHSFSLFIFLLLSLFFWFTLVQVLFIMVNLTLNPTHINKHSLLALGPLSLDTKQLIYCNLRQMLVPQCSFDPAHSSQVLDIPFLLLFDLTLIQLYSVFTLYHWLSHQDLISEINLFLKHKLRLGRRGESWLELGLGLVRMIETLLTLLLLSYLILLNRIYLTLLHLRRLSNSLFNILFVPALEEPLIFLSTKFYNIWDNFWNHL